MAALVRRIDQLVLQHSADARWRDAAASIAREVNRMPTAADHVPTLEGTRPV